MNTRVADDPFDLGTRALEERYGKEHLAGRLAAQIAIARRASEEKSRFFASASHDLRQPLHAIALFGAGTPATRARVRNVGSVQACQRACPAAGPR
jgi:signal transduction histidine kinase